MTWIGGVKRHWAFFSIAVHWSYRSSASEWALPFEAASAALAAMTKPTPGTPSMHLFDDAATASTAISRTSSGRAPKALMESISRRRPARATTLATSAIGLWTPEVVSQWTTKTWLMAGSAL